LLKILKKTYKQFAYRGILLEGMVVSVTEYLMLGGFVLVNFLINHYYGTEVVGVYALSFAIAQIGILGIGSVFSLLMRRDLSIGEYSANSYLAKVQILRSGNMAIVLVFAAAVILGFYSSLRVNLIFILLMICIKGVDALNETYYTAHQTLQDLREYGVFKCSNAIIFVGISAFVCISRFDIVYLYLAQLVCAALMLAVNVFRWQKIRAKQVEEKGLRCVDFRFLLIESYPLIVSAMVFQLGLRANNVLIFDVLGEKDLGIFSLIVITVGVFAGVANTLAIVFFGRLSRVFVEEPRAFSRRLHQTIGLFLGLGIMLMAACLVITPLSEFAFGLAFDRTLYTVMAAAIPFMFMVSCLGTMFTVIRKQKVGMYLTVVVMVFNLLAYFYLPQRYGLIGAGYAFLITAIIQSMLIYLGTIVSLRLIDRDGRFDQSPSRQ